MIKKIAGTAITRVLNAVLMLAVLSVATKNLGDSNYGDVSLIMLAITIIGLVNHFVGGGGLVYYVPRKPLFLLVLPAYLWAFLSAAAGSTLLSVFGKIPEGFTYHVLFLALFQSLASINQNIMLGKERVGQFNAVSLVQFGLLFTALVYLVHFKGESGVLAYVKALYAAYIGTFVLSMVLVYRHVKMTDLQDAGDAVTKMMGYGWRAQLGNVLQFFNYRLNYYILEAFFNKAMLGVFSAGTQLSEGMWIVGKSVSMVQFSKTVNTRDKEYVRMLAVNLVKVTLVLTAMILVVVMLIPVEWFVYFLGEQFSEVKMVIFTLAPGILIVPCSMILSAYFSGTGKPHIGAIGSGIGLVATLAIGFAIIPVYGLWAAGVASSATYLVSAVYLFNRFIKISGSRMSDFYPKKEDMRFIRKELKALKK